MRPERLRGERRRRPAATERVAVALVCAASSIVGLLAGAHPTANRAADAVLVVGFAVAVGAAASIARASAWIVAGGIAGVLAPGLWVIAPVCALAIGIAGATAGDLPHRRTIGALAGGLVVQTVLRLDDSRFGLSAGAAALAVAPLLVSAWPLAHRSTRTRVRVVGLVVTGAGLIVTASFGLMVVRSRTTLALGVQRAEAGLAASRAGNAQRAGVLLDQASRAFADAHRDFRSWFARSASVLPAVGQQERALDLLSSSGAETAAAAADAAARADVQSLEMHGGRLDLKGVASMAEPLASVDAALQQASHAADRADSPWLLSGLASRLDAFANSVRNATRDAQTASDAVTVLPGLLGGHGVRHYFVAFTTPAESRDLGGYTGAYGLLTADHGKLTLARTGRIQDLNNAGLGRHLTQPARFPSRYRSLRIEDFWQNITGTADFPTAAEAVRQMWPQSGGTMLDGVISVDPYALAALLKLTGPVTVVGRPEPLTAENAADFLLRGQYRTFDVIDARSDFLLAIARTVFKRLTTGDLPGPRTIADALAPVARERRLLAYSFHPAEQALFARLGVDGALPAVHGDFLSVRSSNLGQNKIDALLDRSIDDQVVLDPGRGLVHATVDVTLHNAASATGLPRYVIGNLIGAPPGTNVSTVAVYTPLQLRGATIAGKSVPIGAAQEYGRSVYSTRVAVAPGATRTVRFDLEGAMDLHSSYRLDLLPQPAANTDRLRVGVRVTKGWTLSGDQRVSNHFAQDARMVLKVAR